jgi:hypothetical protein
LAPAGNAAGCIGCATLSPMSPRPSRAWWRLHCARRSYSPIERRPAKCCACRRPIAAQMAEARGVHRRERKPMAVLFRLPRTAPQQITQHGRDRQVIFHWLASACGTGWLAGRLVQPLPVRRRHGGKEAAGMRLCQRRQPPEAVAAGQRLRSRIPAATIGRGARGAALFKGKVAGSRTARSGRNLVRVVSSACTGDRGAKSKAGG